MVNRVYCRICGGPLPASLAGRRTHRHCDNENNASGGASTLQNTRKITRVRFEVVGDTGVPSHFGRPDG